MTKAQLLANKLNSALDVGNMSDDYIRRAANRAGAHQKHDAVSVYEDWFLSDETVCHWNADSGVRRWVGRVP